MDLTYNRDVILERNHPQVVSESTLVRSLVLKPDVGEAEFIVLCDDSPTIRSVGHNSRERSVLVMEYPLEQEVVTGIAGEVVGSTHIYCSVDT